MPYSCVCVFRKHLRKYKYESDDGDDDDADDDEDIRDKDDHDGINNRNKWIPCNLNPSKKGFIF